MTPDPDQAAPQPAGGPPRRGFRVPPWVMTSAPLRRLGPRVIPPIHRFILKVTGGRTMLDTAAQPMMMLTTTGAKSGLQRETPLAAIPRPDGTYLVVGSNFARESHPAWTGNLLAHPEATVRFHGRTERVTARLLEGEERAQRWSEALEWYPGWQDYTEATDRTFRLFLLTPIDGTAAG